MENEKTRVGLELYQLSEMYREMAERSLETYRGQDSTDEAADRDWLRRIDKMKERSAAYARASAAAMERSVETTPAMHLLGYESFTHPHTGELLHRPINAPLRVGALALFAVDDSGVTLWVLAANEADAVAVVAEQPDTDDLFRERSAKMVTCKEAERLRYEEGPGAPCSMREAAERLGKRGLVACSDY